MYCLAIIICYGGDGSYSAVRCMVFGHDEKIEPFDGLCNKEKYRLSKSRWY